MERWEMVNNYNYYVSKRSCYREKQSNISTLRESISGYMDLCIGYSDEIDLHRGQAYFFDMLADDNSQRYSQAEKERLLGELDLLSSYISTELGNIQSDINYWDRKIKEYEEEQENSGDI